MGALARRLLDPSPMAIRIHAFYIPVPSPFPQLEEFIEQAVEEYNVDLFHCDERGKAAGEASQAEGGNSSPRLERIPSQDMRRSLQAYKDRFPHITAILIGTRRTDPDGGMFLCIFKANIPFFFFLGSTTTIKIKFCSNSNPVSSHEDGSRLARV